MCGRYYVDDETAREIEKLVRDLDRKLKMERTGDVFPSQNAMILKGMQGQRLHWSALRSGRVYRIGAVLSLPGDFMSGIRARRSLPLSGKKHRFCLWQDAITGMKARRGS